MGATVRKHLRSNVVGYIALFVALTGTAVALPGKNTVDSGDIINETIKAKDIKQDGVGSSEVAEDAISSSEIANDSVTNVNVVDASLTGADVLNESLGGADIDEATFGQVPNALLGGLGRSFDGPACNPGSETFVDCGFTTLNLPQSTRVHLIASARSFNQSGSNAFGFCRLATSQGVLPGIQMGAFATNPVSLNAVTSPLGPGPVDFGIECNQVNGDVGFFEVMVSAVALSPG